MLESFHGAFDGGKLDKILSESMFVGSVVPGSCFSFSVLVMLRAWWRFVSAFAKSEFISVVMFLLGLV